MKLIKFISLPIIVAVILSFFSTPIPYIIGAMFFTELLSYCALFFKLKHSESFDLFSIWGLLVNQYAGDTNVDFFAITHLFGARFLSYLLMWYGGSQPDIWWVGAAGIGLFLTTII
jgi:hypothetical protein